MRKNTLFFQWTLVKGMLREHILSCGHEASGNKNVKKRIAEYTRKYRGVKIVF